MSSAGEQRELNTGIIIAGAYADKVRRTLFAQLGEIARKDREFTKEIARAAAELNVVVYHVLVNQLRVDKGDAVRIRVNYTVEPPRRIKWNYDTLRLEVFKRVPDEQVTQVLTRVVRENLAQILESFRLAPAAAEEAIRAYGLPEEELERRPPQPPTPAPPTPPAVEIRGVDIVSNIKSVDVIGETVDGGCLLKFTSKDGTSMGIGSVTPVEEGVSIDAVIIHGDKCYRFISRSGVRVNVYLETPEKILDDIKNLKPIELGREQALSIIKEKMQSLV